MAWPLVLVSLACIVATLYLALTLGVTLLVNHVLSLRLGVAVRVRRAWPTQRGLRLEGLSISNPSNRAWLGPDALHVGRIELHAGGSLGALAMLGPLQLRLFGKEMVIRCVQRKLPRLELHQVRLGLELDAANLAQLFSSSDAAPRHFSLGVPRVAAARNKAKQETLVGRWASWQHEHEAFAREHADAMPEPARVPPSHTVGAAAQGRMRVEMIVVSDAEIREEIAVWQEVPASEEVRLYPECDAAARVLRLPLCELRDVEGDAAALAAATLAGVMAAALAAQCQHSAAAPHEALAQMGAAKRALEEKAAAAEAITPMPPSPRPGLAKALDTRRRRRLLSSSPSPSSSHGPSPSPSPSSNIGELASTGATAAAATAQATTARAASPDASSTSDSAAPAPDPTATAAETTSPAASPAAASPAAAFPGAASPAAASPAAVSPAAVSPAAASVTATQLAAASPAAASPAAAPAAARRVSERVGYWEDLSAGRQQRVAGADKGTGSDDDGADATMVDANPADVDADASAASPSDTAADEMPAWLLAAETALRGDEAPQPEPQEEDDTPPWLLSAEVLLRDSPAVAESTATATTPPQVGSIGRPRRTSSAGITEFPGLKRMLTAPVMSPLVALKQREPELDPSLALD